ncbi:MAG: type I restriction endonuclease [Oscillospiraceae bacterium]
MDFIDAVKQFSKRIEGMKDSIATEEATKTSLIMPFFQQVLGYDVFNHDEFVPEYTADYANKKGERVDYAIKVDGELSILVEAKSYGEKLDKHGAQLFRYFNTTKARFGILTNGIIYCFFTDLEKDNIMDDTPFFKFNFFDYSEHDVFELKKFQKNCFDVDNIASTASQLKYIGLIKNLIDQMGEEPSENFVKFILSEVYDGVKTQSVLDKFKPLIKIAFNDYISELMSEKITTALKNNTKVELSPEEKIEEIEEADTDDGICTTEQEREAFYSVRTILNEVMPREDVTYKDTKAYFGILYKDNTWKWICRFKFKKNGLVFTLPDDNKKEIRHDLKNLDEINNFKNEIRAVGKRYVGE